jgi:membrane protein
MQDIRSRITKIIHFITTDIWKIRLDTVSRTKSLIIKLLRVFLLSIRGFAEDNCTLRASALTFYSLISIVPVVAMALAVAKGFGLQKHLREQLLTKFPGQEEVMTWILNFSVSLLESIKGGVLAGFGVIVLLWAIIKVLSHIEESLNDIWKIKKNRSLWRKLSDYFAVMFVFPFLLIMSSSMMVLINTQITMITEKIALIGFFSPVIFFMIELLPYILLWTLFTFIYILMPNTKVDFGPGFMAGVIAGTMFSITQWIYITFQISVSKYNAIYGSFAALPLFMIWLQLSWLIILYGAELSFAYQHVDTYEFEPESRNISSHFKKLLSLHIAHLSIKKFARGEAPLTARQISQMLAIPLGLVHQILYDLTESGILSDVQTDEYKESAYQPARDINMLTMEYVLEVIDKKGVDVLPVAQTEALKVLSQSLQTFRETIQASPANMLLKDI